EAVVDGCAPRVCNALQFATKIVIIAERIGADAIKTTRLTCQLRKRIVAVTGAAETISHRSSVSRRVIIKTYLSRRRNICGIGSGKNVVKRLDQVSTVISVISLNAARVGD